VSPIDDTSTVASGLVASEFGPSLKALASDDDQQSSRGARHHRDARLRQLAPDCARHHDCLEGIAAGSTSGPRECRLASMLRFIRLALQLVLFCLLLSLVVAVGSAETGGLEKVVLIVVGAALVWLASHVRRIGAPAHRA
jgi:hypothetical protein